MIAKEVFWRDKQMSYSESVEWELAKQAELSYLQNGEWVREGIDQFVNGRYKPALESYTNIKEGKNNNASDSGGEKTSNRLRTNRGAKK